MPKSRPGRLGRADAGLDWASTSQRRSGS
jgi:hypothetical protein